MKHVSPFMWMLIPALVSVIGGIVALIWHPSRPARSMIQHFAAGVILAALATELLPEIGREHARPWVLIVAFAVGSMIMFAMKLITDHLEEKDEKRLVLGGAVGLPFGMLMATMVDIAVDGLIIGAGFATGGETGVILALGLSVEMLFLGLALVSDALKGWRVLALTGFLGIEILGFAYLGNVLLSGAGANVLGAVLAASAAALLYLVTEELLIEAHEVKERPYYTLILFAGFLVFWSVQMLGVAQ